MTYLKAATCVCSVDIEEGGMQLGKKWLLSFVCCIHFFPIRPLLNSRECCFKYFLVSFCLGLAHQSYIAYIYFLLNKDIVLSIVAIPI